MIKQYVSGTLSSQLKASGYEYSGEIFSKKMGPDQPPISTTITEITSYGYYSR